MAYLRANRHTRAAYARKRPNTQRHKGGTSDVENIDARARAPQGVAGKASRIEASAATAAARNRRRHLKKIQTHTPKNAPPRRVTPRWIYFESIESMRCNSPRNRDPTYRGRWRHRIG